MILPIATAAAASLGALMYAGTSGYDCVGAYDNRSVAHAPMSWPVYLAACLVALAASLLPLALGLRKGDASHQH